MSHPLSGLQAQLGQAQLGSADFSNQSIVEDTPDYDNEGFVDDFAGINGESDEALAGFGSGDMYVGSSFGVVAAKKAKRSTVTNKKAKKVIGKAIFNPFQNAMAKALKKAAAKPIVGSKEVVNTSIPGLERAGVNTSLPVAERARVNRSIPSINEDSVMDYYSDSDDSDSDSQYHSKDEELMNPSARDGEVVSNGGELTQAQLAPKVAVVKKKSSAAHPMLIYAHAFHGFEGLWDDIKSSVSKTVSTTVKSGTDNLLTNITSAVTGQKVLTDAAKRAAAQKAAEKAIEQTRAAAAALVQKAQDTGAYLEANKQKLLLALAAVGGLGAYLLFVRRRA